MEDNTYKYKVVSFDLCFVFMIIINTSHAIMLSPFHIEQCTCVKDLGRLLNESSGVLAWKVHQRYRPFFQETQSNYDSCDLTNKCMNNSITNLGMLFNLLLRRVQIWLPLRGLKSRNHELTGLFKYCICN